MNRKGFLLGEFTLKTIVAVLSILLLAFLLFSLYSSFSDNSDIRKAEATVGKVVEGVIIASNTDKPYNYILLEPNDWILMYFESGGPERCEAGRKCLCLCEKEGLLDSQIEKCNDEGACRAISSSLFMSPIKIDGPTDIAISKVEGGFRIEKKNG